MCDGHTSHSVSHIAVSVPVKPGQSIGLDARSQHSTAISSKSNPGQKMDSHDVSHWPVAIDSVSPTCNSWRVNEVLLGMIL